MFHLQPQANKPPAPSAADPDPDGIELDEEEGTEGHKKARSSAMNAKSQSSRWQRRQEVSESVGGRQNGVEDVEEEEQEDE